ncbi:MAG TPA: hypothetical protein VG326_19455 [Tepidisphaeraceae bacterium]|jgi:Spy/CpxP family protein refolding chaperone|nr:hypothetical protein [Tepidisphaeraceae bacterium]
MKTNIAKLILAAVFVVTLSAGVVGGLLASRLPAIGSHDKILQVDDSSLAGELGLNADQRDAMRKIWIGVRDLSQASYETAVKYKSEQETAIAALIPAEKLSAYNEIRRSYAEKNAALKGRRQAEFEKAIAETRRILTAPQRAKYDEILKKRLGPDAGLNHDPLGEPTT